MDTGITIVIEHHQNNDDAQNQENTNDAQDTQNNENPNDSQDNQETHDTDGGQSEHDNDQDAHGEQEYDTDQGGHEEEKDKDTQGGGNNQYDDSMGWNDEYGENAQAEWDELDKGDYPDDDWVDNSSENPPPGGDDRDNDSTHGTVDWFDPDVDPMPEGKNWCLFFCMEAADNDKLGDYETYINAYIDYCKNNNLQVDFVKDGITTSYDAYLFVDVFGVLNSVKENFINIYFDTTPTNDHQQVIEAIHNNKAAFASFESADGSQHEVIIISFDVNKEEFRYWDPIDAKYHNRDMDYFQDILIINGFK